MDKAANMYTSMEVEYDSDEEVQDVGNELNTWLAQLSISQPDRNASTQNQKTSSAGNSSLLTQSHTMESFRCSVIMDLDGGGNCGDLDDIINDLCALEAELSDAQKELSTKQPLTDGDSGNVDDMYYSSSDKNPSKHSENAPATISHAVQFIKITHQPLVPSYSNCPKELDDTPIQHAQQIQQAKTAVMWDRDNEAALRAANAAAAQAERDKEQRAKEEKIRLAIQKIQAADIKKLFVKVFVQNGENRTILVDEKMSVHEILLMLFDKCEAKPNVRWTLVEQIPDLYIERIIEDHEKLINVMMNWLKVSNNKILFLETDDKYDLFFQPQNYLLNKERRDKCIEKEQRALLDELFGGAGTQVPELEGDIYCKVEGQKTWKKMTAVLRSSGLYAKKGKSTKGLQSLVQFDQVEVYRGFGWRKKFKAPTEHCFALKHPKLQKKSKDIKYFCCEDEYTLKKWLMGMRIAKYGKELQNGFKRMLDVVSGNRKPSTGTIDTPSDSMSQSSRDSGFSVTSDSSNSLDLSNSGKKKIHHNHGDGSMPPPPPDEFSDLPPPPPELLGEEATPTNTPVHFASHMSGEFRLIHSNSIDDSSSIASNRSGGSSSSSLSHSTPRNSIDSNNTPTKPSFDRCSSIRNSLRKGQSPTPPKLVQPPKIPHKSLPPTPAQKPAMPSHSHGHYSSQFTQPLPQAASLSLASSHSQNNTGNFMTELKNIYAKKNPTNTSANADSDVDDLPPPPPELLSPEIQTENPYDIPYKRQISASNNSYYNDTYSVPPPPLEYNPYGDRAMCNGTLHRQNSQQEYSMSRVFASQTGTIKRAPPPPKRNGSTTLTNEQR